MQQRVLVIGDIHGGLLALQEILSNANVGSNDKLIFLGDYVDGWSHSPQVLDFLINLQEKQQCIFIRGNHDQLLLDWLEKSKTNFNEEMWFKHGGEATVKAYNLISAVKRQVHVEFLKSLQNYYIDNQNRLFVHAGFTNLNGVAFEYFPELFYWDRTLWETALCLDTTIDTSSAYYPKRFSNYKEIFIGHTPVTKINETKPLKYANVWNVDTGAAFCGSLTIMDVDSKEYWQSKPLNLLYPDEKGRN
ncbi:metallophosphoesterase family protein [Flavobacterium sp.]|uniref:metallophosphoesterase family protein n=1 Tax=Flavobacterium sp. TaxID=239 RepID=UPI0037C0661F